MSGLSPIIEVQIAGEDGPIDARQFNTSEKRRLMYVSHEISENELVIVQRSELIETRSHFVSFEGGALRTYTEVKNISDKEIILEHVSSFFCGNIAERKNTDKIFLYRFTNSHHAECQPRKISLSNSGFFRARQQQKARVRLEYGQSVHERRTRAIYIARRNARQNVYVPDRKQLKLVLGNRRERREHISELRRRKYAS